MSATIKVIVIKRCDECPHFRADGVKPDLCLEEGRRIPADVDIPDWCPLEDKNAIDISNLPRMKPHIPKSDLEITDE